MGGRAQGQARAAVHHVKLLRSFLPEQWRCRCPRLNLYVCLPCRVLGIGPHNWPDAETMAKRRSALGDSVRLWRWLVDRWEACISTELLLLARSEACSIRGPGGGTHAQCIDLSGAGSDAARHLRILASHGLLAAAGTMTSTLQTSASQSCGLCSGYAF